MECMRESFQGNQILDGRFRTIAPLNHGSFGMVFLAEDLVTGQEVAIKCLTKPNTSDNNIQPTFDEGAEELACHAILKFHPHLVNLVHHFQTQNHQYLVLEYCSQGDLYEAIRNERGPLETEHVRRFMLQLISAVEHMHKNGLYHRDIKPENIFLSQDGAVKLGDFGLATRSLWSYEACVGSDRYMAPEQYDPAGNGYSPAKADLWSIGICLLNVLFARNPFTMPNESDVLFSDYVRDRQSLFDIFTTMSQDTFEVLSIAMAVDPSKRDLTALKEAVIRVVSFTTDDEDLDEFCTEERDVVRASANREPLRTPSLQSPNMDGEAFPWAKALHTSPPQRQLSAIPDDSDFYDEDLFPASEKGLNLGESWFSAKFNTPSVASVLDSAFSGSYKSVPIRQSARNPPRPGPISIPNSLPAPAPRPIPTMSSVFGKKDSVAKSWSDMWDEDEEESEREDAVVAQPEPARNTRVRSHESSRKPSVASNILREKKSCSALNARPRQSKGAAPRKTSSSSNENEPFGWKLRTPKKSPKQVPADKWAALGDRRRNFQTEPEITTPTYNKRRSLTMSSKKKPVSPTSNENQAWHRRDSRSKNRPAHLNQDWRQHKTVDSSPDDDHHEWVGGWHTFHL